MSLLSNLTLGSLFDGIGGFPYAASFFGITTLWASEILPQAVSITMRHFPDTEHVGDITTLDGGKLQPVDIITFGSPCQDLSTAGKRLGMSGERSSLFYEAIRIIDEMREATDGKYPKYAVWENVPGALSSGGGGPSTKPRGSDFRAVLEAFTKAKIPIPDSGHWANAGLVRGKEVSVAWVCKNAQYHGVPQRRRRIFLVASFGAGCPGEILFIEESLRGHTSQGGQAEQGIAGHTERCVGSAVQGCCLNPWDTQQSRVFAGDGVSPTLAGADGGGGRNPAGLVIHDEQPASAIAYGISSFGSHAMLSDNPKAGIYKADTSRTLDHNGGRASCNQGGLIILEPVTPQESSSVVLNDQGGENISVEKSDISPTLRCEAHGHLPIVAKCRCQDSLAAVGVHQNQSGEVNISDTAYTLATTSNASSRNAPLIACERKEVHPDVAAVDCRNYKEICDISGTLQAKDKPGYSLNYQNPVRIAASNSKYIVRRLTPTECERLQGFPDGWTKYGHDGKEISDTRRYMVLGNSVAIPVVAFVMCGILVQFIKTADFGCGKEVVVNE